jgi:hypothetical protein
VAEVPRDWIQDTLEAIRRERARAVQGAAPPPGQMAPQPPGPVGGMPAQGPPKGMPGASGIMGMPGHPFNEGQAELRARDVSPDGRQNALIEAYQAYLKKSGRRQDPLLDAVRERRRPGGTAISDGARPVLGPGGEAFSVNTSNNERRGLTMQKFDLPGGRRVHVYYGANGERTVIRLPKKR